jgi:hypothetical protein
MSFGDLSVNKGNRPANNFVQKDEFGQLSDSLQIFQVWIYDICSVMTGALLLGYFTEKLCFSKR